MKYTDQSFIASKRKIAFTFVLFSSLMMILTTSVIILIIRYQMSLEAKKVLSGGLASINTAFQDNHLEEISVSFQADKTKTAEYEKKNRLLNIFDVQKDRANNSLEQSSPVFVADEKSFAKLKENHQIYSRVILANGDILYSSDLFDILFIDPNKFGFHQYSVRGICIYSQTEKIIAGEQQGAIIQVAQYCPFTTKQQQTIAIIMLLITFMASILAYVIGIIFADYFLKPFEKSVTQARVFVQNVYHELFTPVSVAITTVAAALRKKNYKEGLESVNDDLTKIQESLQLLSDKAFKEQAKLSTERINISQLLKEVISEVKLVNNESNLEINVSKIENDIYQLVNVTGARLIFKNLIENSYKFSAKGSTILVSLSAHTFTISNKSNDIKNIDVKNVFTRYYRGGNSEFSTGKGLGLALVKELADVQGWKVAVALEEDLFRVTINF